MNINKPCFIIAHKYYRGYQSYLSHYLDNINDLYPDATIIVVDNNSKYIEDIVPVVESHSNVHAIINASPSKFEVGAYSVGIQYAKENNIIENHSYFVFTQDNFILKNKFDFGELVIKDTKALPINSFYQDGEGGVWREKVLNDLQMNDNMDKVNFCWCSSFILRNDKVEQMHEWLKKIKCTIRMESCAAERYLARLLWELNDRIDCGDIDGDIRTLPQRHYDTWKVDPLKPATSYFVKKVQQKNERTRDVE